MSVGAVFALFTSLLGAMFPLPRVLYAMASDGLLYKVFKSVNERTKTPLNATIIAGTLAAVMALVFDLHQLIDMMSIGNLGFLDNLKALFNIETCSIIINLI